MRPNIAALALVMLLSGLALPPASAEVSGRCNDIAVGQNEYVIVMETGEVVLVPVDGDIGLRIRPDGVAERFRVRPGEDQSTVRADVELVGGEVVRGHICTGCFFAPGEVVPVEILSNQVYLEKAGLVYEVPLHLLMSLEPKGGGEWAFGFRIGDTLTGRLTLPRGVTGFSMTNDYGVVNLPLDKIASVTILGSGD